MHLLSEDMLASSRQIVLGVTKNKIQLNKMLTDALTSLPFETTLHHTLKRVDLKSEQEEADGVVVQHAIMAALQGQNVRVVSEDTYVFMILVHFYHTMSITTSLVMSLPSKDRAVISIKATSVKHSAIASDLLAIHAISGPDTVASYFGIGKGKAAKVLQKVSLLLLGNPAADIIRRLSSGYCHYVYLL